MGKLKVQTKRVVASIMAAAMVLTTVFSDSSVAFASQNAKQLRSVFVDETDHVKVSINNEADVSATTVEIGSEVKVEPIADAGYVTTGLTVTDTNGNEIIESHDGSAYTFVMPNSDVTVKASVAEGQDDSDSVSASDDGDSVSASDTSSDEVLAKDTTEATGTDTQNETTAESTDATEQTSEGTTEATSEETTEDLSTLEVKDEVVDAESGAVVYNKNGDLLFNVLKNSDEDAINTAVGNAMEQFIGVPYAEASDYDVVNATMKAIGEWQDTDDFVEFAKNNGIEYKTYSSTSWAKVLNAFKTDDYAMFGDVVVVSNADGASHVGIYVGGSCTSGSVASSSYFKPYIELSDEWWKDDNRFENANRWWTSVETEDESDGLGVTGNVCTGLTAISSTSYQISVIPLYRSVVATDDGDLKITEDENSYTLMSVDEPCKSVINVNGAGKVYIFDGETDEEIGVISEDEEISLENNPNGKKYVRLHCVADEGNVVTIYNAMGADVRAGINEKEYDAYIDLDDYSAQDAYYSVSFGEIMTEEEASEFIDSIQPTSSIDEETLENDIINTFQEDGEEISDEFINEKKLEVLRAIDDEDDLDENGNQYSEDIRALADIKTKNGLPLKTFNKKASFTTLDYHHGKNFSSGTPVLTGRGTIKSKHDPHKYFTTTSIYLTDMKAKSGTGANASDFEKAYGKWTILKCVSGHDKKAPEWDGKGDVEISYYNSYKRGDKTYYDYVLKWTPDNANSYQTCIGFFEVSESNPYKFRIKKTNINTVRLRRLNKKDDGTYSVAGSAYDDAVQWGDLLNAQQLEAEDRDSDEYVKWTSLNPLYSLGGTTFKLGLLNNYGNEGGLDIRMVAFEKYRNSYAYKEMFSQESAFGYSVFPPDAGFVDPLKYVSNNYDSLSAETRNAIMNYFFMYPLRATLVSEGLPYNYFENPSSQGYGKAQEYYSAKLATLGAGYANGVHDSYYYNVIDAYGRCLNPGTILNAQNENYYPKAKDSEFEDGGFNDLVVQGTYTNTVDLNDDYYDKDEKRFYGAIKEISTSDYYVLRSGAWEGECGIDSDSTDDDREWLYAQEATAGIEKDQRKGRSAKFIYYTSSTKTFTAKVENVPKLRPFVFYKEDTSGQNGDPSGNGNGLAGAVYEIKYVPLAKADYKSSQLPSETVVQGGNGTGALFTYYVKLEDITANVIAMGKGTEGKKYYGWGAGYINLAGDAQGHVNFIPHNIIDYDADHTSAKYWPMTTGAYCAYGFPCGYLEIKEIEAPKGYEKDDTVHVVEIPTSNFDQTITTQNNGFMGNTVEAHVGDTPKTGTIQVAKKEAGSAPDEWEPSGDKTFEGAVFAAYNVSNHDVVINGTTYTTWKSEVETIQKDGWNTNLMTARGITPCMTATVKKEEATGKYIATFSGLPCGTYVIKEIEAPYGYRVNKKWYQTDHLILDWEGHDAPDLIRHDDAVDKKDAVIEQEVVAGFSLTKIDELLADSTDHGDASLLNVKVKLYAHGNQNSDDGTVKYWRPGETRTTVPGGHSAHEGEEIGVFETMRVLYTDPATGEQKYRYIWTTDTNQDGHVTEGSEFMLSVGGYRIVEITDEVHESYDLTDTRQHDFYITEDDCAIENDDGSLTGGIIDLDNNERVTNGKVVNIPYRSGFYLTKVNYDKRKNEAEGDTDLMANFVVINRSLNKVAVPADQALPPTYEPGKICYQFKTDPENGTFKSPQLVLPYGTYEVYEITKQQAQLFDGNLLGHTVAELEALEETIPEGSTGTWRGRKDAYTPWSKTFSIRDDNKNGDKWFNLNEINPSPAPYSLSSVNADLNDSMFNGPVNESYRAGFWLEKRDFELAESAKVQGDGWLADLEAYLQEEGIDAKDIKFELTNKSVNESTGTEQSVIVPSYDYVGTDYEKKEVRYGEVIGEFSAELDEEKGFIVTTDLDRDGIADRESEFTLPYGTYEIKEKKTNESYVLTDGNPRTIKITKDDTDKIIHKDATGKDLLWFNHVQRGGVMVKKMDNELEDSLIGGDMQGDATLEGAEFSIYNMSKEAVYVPAKEDGGVLYQPGEIVAKIYTEWDADYVDPVTKAEGAYIAKTAPDALPFGTYRMVETKASNGYLLDEDFEANFRIRMDKDKFVIEDLDAKKDEDGNYSGKNVAEIADYTESGYQDDDVIVYDYDAERDLQSGDYRTERDDFTVVDEDGKLILKQADAKVNGKRAGALETVIRGGVQVVKFDKELEESEALEGADYSEYEDGAKLKGIEFTIYNKSQRHIYGPANDSANRPEEVDEYTRAVWTEGRRALGGVLYEPGDAVMKIYTHWNPDYVDPDTGKVGAYTAETGAYDLPYGTYEIRETATNKTYNLTDTTPRTFCIRKDGEIVSWEFIDPDTVDPRLLETKWNVDTRKYTVDFFGEEIPAQSKDNEGKYFLHEGNGDLFVLEDAGDEEGLHWKYITSFEPKNDNETPYCLRGEPLKFYNYVVRGNFHFTKIGEHQERLSIIPFLVTNLATGEAHVVVADTNGESYTNTLWAKHSYKTNENDEVYNDYVDDETVIKTEDLHFDYGVWFGKGEFGSVAPVRDDLPALPYGKYNIKELRCEGNVGYELVEFNMYIYRQDHEVDLGTITDKEGRPLIETMALDAETLTHMANADSDVKIQDTVYLSNLIKGKKYKIRGTLTYFDEEGEVVRGADGKKAKAELEFEADDNVMIKTLDFDVDASELNGKTVVVFEEIYDGKWLSLLPLASHTDVNDKEQTIYFPEIKTSAYDQETNAHTGNSSSDVKEYTIVDKVAYTNLIAGNTYKIQGTLMDKSTGSPYLDVNGEVVKAEKEFTAEMRNGNVELEFKFQGSLSGKTIVVFEDMYYNGQLVASHADLTDEDQSVYYPGLHTNATDILTKDEVGSNKKTYIVDRVSYEGLTPGETYTIKGVLMNKATGKPVLYNGEDTKDGTKVTPGKIDVSTESSEVSANDVTVNVTVGNVGSYGAGLTGGDDTNTTAGTTDTDNTTGTTNTDNTTGTTDTDATADTTTDATTTTGTTDKDTIEFIEKTTETTEAAKAPVDLTDPGTTEDIKVDKYGKSVKSATSGSNEGYLVAEKTFTPKEPNGTIDLKYEVDENILKGKITVVFESLYSENDELITTHEDINDEAQTVYFPSIKTSAKDQKTGNRKGENGETTIVDTVTYKNLVPGREYEMKGYLVNSKGKKIKKKGKAVTASTKFVPNTSDGSVELEFNFTAKNNGKVVVFEELYHNGELVEWHKDLNDNKQTVTYPGGKESKTTGGSGTPGKEGVQTSDIGMYLILALLALGVAILGYTVYRKKKLVK